MKKIAVLCALSTERNTGMATVDMVAHSMIRRIAPGAQVTLYVYGKINEHTYQPGELPYHYLDATEHEEQYFSSDIFIFWGDFIHSRSYWKLDRGEWGGNKESMQKEFERYAKFAFLSQLPEERLKHAIVFGSTIITNDAEDEMDALYYQHYKRFFANAGTVLFRDALSAAKISPYRASEATLASDCVFLLKDEDVRQLKEFSQAASRKGIGVFFGRTPAKYRMMLFSRLVGRELGEPCSWVGWFASRMKFRLAARAFGYGVARGYTSPGQLLGEVSGYRFIITDTYHLCINAWRMGVPAICIGRGAGRSADSLGDKKKEILYEMYGARQFYRFVEKVRSPRIMWSEVRRAREVLQNKALAEAVMANIAMHQAMTERRLREAMNDA